MVKKIDLILLGNLKNQLSWPLGKVWHTEPIPKAVYNLIEAQLQNSDAEFWLFWDSAFEPPKTECVLSALNKPGDVWHAGLKLGMAGFPALIDFVAPTWLLNKDPDKNTEATSWRLSLRACLIRTNILRKLGHIRPEFKRLDGATLEMGHRFINHGALTRHIPWLAPENADTDQQKLVVEDELRFICYRFGHLWCFWALIRALLTGSTSPLPTINAWRKMIRMSIPPQPEPFCHDFNPSKTEIREAKVSVLIPTLDRYSYLLKLLSQLRDQTIKPFEIIVIDQTEVDRRITTLEKEFDDLPIKLICQDKAGQCSSRNRGLKSSTGDYILFLDDDDEVPPTLMEDHLINLHRYNAYSSSGIANEIGAGPLPKHFTYFRASDVFPTNNTMIKRETLYPSGLFDLAYDRGQRADADLGMRVYLSGAVMVLNPDIAVLHYHAPRGGLRSHNARVITYASSRQNIYHRHLPSITEIYMAKRYFAPRQVQEMLWLRIFGTFSVRGNLLKRIIKFLVSLISLPDTLWQVRKRSHQAKIMLNDYPQIPVFTMCKSEVVKETL